MATAAERRDMAAQGQTYSTYTPSASVQTPSYSFSSPSYGGSSSAIMNAGSNTFTPTGSSGYVPPASSFNSTPASTAAPVPPATVAPPQAMTSAQAAAEAKMKGLSGADALAYVRSKVGYSDYSKAQTGSSTPTSTTTPFKISAPQDLPKPVSTEPKSVLTGLTLGGKSTDLGKSLSDSLGANKFDSTYFNPFAQQIDKAAQERMDMLNQYTETQNKSIAETAAAQEKSQLAQEEAAQQAKLAGTNLVGMEDYGAARQIEQSRRKAFGSLQARLQQLGGLGTTGAGELNVGILNQAFDDQAQSVQLNSAKRLQEIESKYNDVYRAIQMDRSKTAAEKQAAIRSLNDNAMQMWSSIQADKNTQVTALAKEAYTMAAQKNLAAQTQGIAAMQSAIESGIPVTQEMYTSLGISPELQTVYNAIQQKSKTASNMTDFNTRMAGMQAAVLPDFTVDTIRVKNLADLLMTDYPTLLREAQALAAASKVANDRKVAEDIKLQQVKNASSGGAGALKLGTQIQGADGKWYQQVVQNGQISYTPIAVDNVAATPVKTPSIIDVITSGIFGQGSSSSTIYDPHAAK